MIDKDKLFNVRVIHTVCIAGKTGLLFNLQNFINTNYQIG